MSTFALTIYRAELNYDVQQYTYKVGQTRLTDEQSKLRFEIQADADSEDQLHRWYQKAMSDLKGDIKQLNRVTTNAAQNDQLGTLPESYTFTFVDADRLRKEIDKEAVSYIHEYMVSSALTEWFKQSYPNESAACAARCQELTGLIEKLFYTKTLPARPTYTGNTGGGTTTEGGGN